MGLDLGPKVSQSQTCSVWSRSFSHISPVLAQGPMERGTARRSEDLPSREALCRWAWVFSVVWRHNNLPEPRVFSRATSRSCSHGQRATSCRIWNSNGTRIPVQITLFGYEWAKELFTEKGAETGPEMDVSLLAVDFFVLVTNNCGGFCLFF